ncbi:hypothetical protein LCGC14_1823180, partial [marine sediment metagenome]
MRQTIIGGADNSLNSGVTEYNNICGGQQWHATEALKAQIVSTAGTFSYLWVELDGTPDFGASWIFTLMKNGVAQSLAVTLSDDDLQVFNDISSFTVAAGDTISLRATSSGGPTNRKARWACRFKGDAAEDSILLGSVGKPTKTSSRYHLIQGVDVSSTSENYAIQIIPTAGKLKNLYVKMRLAPGSGSEAYSYTLRVNNVSKALTCTITGAATTGNDTTNEVDVVAGDRVALIITPLNSPTNSTDAFLGMTFQPTAKGESIIMGGSITGPSTEKYAPLQHNVYTYVDEASEALIYQEILSGYLKNLYVWTTDLPGSASWDITI